MPSAVALGSGAVLLMAAALTWLPGTLPWAGARWLPVVMLVAAFPVVVAAVVRGILAKADRATLWVAFRCLPGRVQAVMAALVALGLAVVFSPGGGSGSLQEPEARDGRYVAFNTAPRARGTVEITQARHREPAPTSSSVSTPWTPRSPGYANSAAG
ncbi:hypothetical protein AB0957_34475, partial [Streptomyces zhihengii]|uniref:hypothetical protein n=1 Tax=Streptomyces zhihengii TaxID=1818004 RepID=UPI003456405B